MNADFEAIIEQSIAKCTTLSPPEARHFLEHGWVVVKAVVSKQIAADIVACAWRELEERGIMKNEPETWKQEPYIWTGCPPDINIMASRGDKEAACADAGDQDALRLAAGKPPAAGGRTTRPRRAT